MKIKKEIKGNNLEFWGKAKDVVKYIDPSEIDMIIENIFNDTIYPNGVTEEEVNDFFSNNADEIAFFLRFRNFEDLMKKRKHWVR